MQCAKHFTNPIEESTFEEILSFITSRVKSVFEDLGFQKDSIEASLQGQCFDPLTAFYKLKALTEFRKTPEFSGFYEVYKRVKGLLDPHCRMNIGLLTHPAEKNLFDAFTLAKKQIASSVEKGDFFQAFQALTGLQNPLSFLLQEVKIHAEDPLVRESRTALLTEVFFLFTKLIDLSQIREK